MYKTKLHFAEKRARETPLAPHSGTHFLIELKRRRLFLERRRVRRGRGPLRARRPTARRARLGAPCTLRAAAEATRAGAPPKGVPSLYLRYPARFGLLKGFNDEAKVRLTVYLRKSPKPSRPALQPLSNLIGILTIQESKRGPSEPFPPRARPLAPRRPPSRSRPGRAHRAPATQLFGRIDLSFEVMIDLATTGTVSSIYIYPMSSLFKCREFQRTRAQVERPANPEHAPYPQSLSYTQSKPTLTHPEKWWNSRKITRGRHAGASGGRGARHLSFSFRIRHDGISAVARSVAFQKNSPSLRNPFIPVSSTLQTSNVDSYAARAPIRASRRRRRASWRRSR